MNVDLPAPLSPSTHVTSLACTLVVMFCRASTLPNDFDTRCSSIRAWPLASKASRPAGWRSPASISVMSAPSTATAGVPGGVGGRAGRDAVRAQRRIASLENAATSRITPRNR